MFVFHNIKPKFKFGLQKVPRSASPKNFGSGTIRMYFGHINRET